jgi:hypothetical protein
MIGFSNCVMRTIVPLDGTMRSYWESWCTMVQDSVTGNGGYPVQYQRNFSVFELDPKGNPSRVWSYTAAWPVSYKVNAKSSLDDSNDVLEFIELCYNRREVKEF